jgi:Cu-Zn family superoxide dismutase
MKYLLATVALCPFVLAGCDVGEVEGGARASGAIMGLGTDTMTGMVSFTQSGSSVTVNVMVTGVVTNPDAMHGVHIHETGDCGMAGMNAGSHWNPTGAMHGDWGATPSHVGDLGNMQVTGGSGTLSRTESSRWCVGCSDAMKNVVGHAVIVHANPDDLSQPAGNAGGRVGCAVIASE